MSQRPTFLVMLRRAWRKRCPNCGTAPLFHGWYDLVETCPACGVNFATAEGNTWFFMYFSSAAVVGLCFGYLLFFPPSSALEGWLTIVPAAAAVMLLTLPLRKSFAIGLDHFISPLEGPAAPPADDAADTQTRSDASGSGD